MKNTLEAQARLTFNKVAYDKDNEAHLVVSLKAPKIDWQAKRPPVCIIPVIDISPSMEGQKMLYAKQSVLKLIDNLQPGDFCGIVAFGGQVFTVSKPVEVTQAQKDRLKAAVGQLTTNGSTNFSGGMCQGLDLLNKGDLPDGVLQRVIMFTDGMPNTGIAIKRDDIVKLLEQTLGNATLSAFGYGADADQELLADVAKTGKGNYAFIRNPEDALSAFAKELGGLLSTYAQNITVEVAPHNGHTIVETVSDVEAKEDGKKVLVTLPDILSEEERHLVFKVKLDKQPNAFPRQSSVFDVVVEYDMLDDGKSKKRCNDEVKAKVQFVKADEADGKPIPEVDRIVGLAQLVAAQIQAEEMAKAGNFAGAVAFMTSTSSDYQSRGFDDLAKVAVNVGGTMGSASVYAHSTGYLNSMKSGTTRSYGTSGMDAQAAADLNVVGVSLNNSAQDDMQKAWGAGAGVVGTPAVPSGNGNLVVQPGGAVNVPWTLTPMQPFVQPNLVPAPVVPAPAPKSKVSKSKSKRW
jgi:Ca-activated chloride channel family protein